MTASEGAVRSASDRHPAMIAYPRGAVRAFVGHPHLFPLPTAASGVHRARGRGRAHPLEPREAPGDLRHDRSEEHTSELQSRLHLVCRLLLEKKKKKV